MSSQMSAQNIEGFFDLPCLNNVVFSDASLGYQEFKENVKKELLSKYNWSEEQVIQRKVPMQGNQMPDQCSDCTRFIILGVSYTYLA
jgi:hypothetical protein